MSTEFECESNAIDGVPNPNLPMVTKEETEAFLAQLNAALPPGISAETHGFDTSTEDPDIDDEGMYDDRDDGELHMELLRKLEAGDPETVAFLEAVEQALREQVRDKDGNPYQGEIRLWSGHRISGPVTDQSNE